MPSRLDELHRQRALLREHLAWLDREIAAAENASPAPAPAGTTAPALPAVPDLAPLPSVPSSDRPGPVDADEMLAQYRTQSQDLRTDVRKGCFLYFTTAFLALGLLVAGLYFYFSSQH